jgi:hypothetical protein
VADDLCGSVVNFLDFNGQVVLACCVVIPMFYFDFAAGSDLFLGSVLVLAFVWVSAHSQSVLQSRAFVPSALSPHVLQRSNCWCYFLFLSASISCLLVSIFTRLVCRGVIFLLFELLRPRFHCLSSVAAFSGFGLQ